MLTRGGEESPAEEAMNGVHVHRVREPTRPAELNEFVAWVERMNSDMLAAGVELGDRHNFDLVHGHDWLVANACDHLAKRFEAPLVTTIHATEHGRHQGWVEKHPQSYIHGVERWITNRSDRVIACSTTCASRSSTSSASRRDRDRGDPERDRPRGPAASRRRRARRLRSSSPPPTSRSCCWWGGSSTRRGSSSRSRRCRAIIERLRNTRFIVAGSGTHEQELRRQAEELGLMSHGTFVGWIGDDVLHSLYRIADVCVVPSIYEPFGLVALEAMASSCPCIVADTGGLREVVPHDEVGLRFRARDPESLAEMAVRVLEDAELCRRLVADAIEHLRRFDWGDVAERTVLPSALTRSSPPIACPPDPAASASPARCCSPPQAPQGSTGSGQRSSLGASRMRITFAGTPPTTALAGTSLVTTALVPMIALSPTRTPRRMQAP